MPLNCLVYVSLANPELSDDDLKSMLQKARVFNKEHEITGMLLFREGFFMQAIEGEQDDVEKLFESIAKDPRHRDVLLIYNKPITMRGFPDWTMGFNKLIDADFCKIEGYTDFLNQPSSDFFINRANEAELLLNQFKQRQLF
ncbi:MAG: BLUF domain-containing protein [Methylococcales bacterium]|nr:BLUF domain-containing protein [Methylococcales bacterium]